MEADCHLNLLYCATADSIEKAKFLPCDRSIVQIQHCPTILSVTGSMSITNRIRFNNLRGDIFGGVTAAIVSLPLALAFGVASGVGLIGGLYGAVCVGFFAALFGGTPTLISEPTGPMTVVMTAIAPHSYSL
jgi:MFS superfamily sulfate permease-like transporter